ncbi:MAG: hypothetical protein GWO16_08360 [Gammaproteobacteria bacterium]|nr:hypothetical protein [Gammaproteobacteria bacterium]NIR97961.1 hypothetical protein [Gammaproteobacteria bacterium]NIT63661.1 hypothetical protein [Gammaproteobacteria bacterium]NIV21519.1 hypothetical protein [Gammaproteobacteria bacterium]NIY32241.1 hypothetical protein [Gammaproteobacteria bacterium]
MSWIEEDDDLPGGQEALEGLETPAPRQVATAAVFATLGALVAWHISRALCRESRRRRRARLVRVLLACALLGAGAALWWLP